MRHAVLVLALLGALGPAGAAVTWLVVGPSYRARVEKDHADLSKYETDEQERAKARFVLLISPEKKGDLRHSLDTHNTQSALVYHATRAWPFLLTAALLAVLGGVLAELRYNFSAAVLLAGALVAPAVVHPAMLCFGFLLLVPAVLALFAGDRRRPPPPAGDDLDPDRPYRRRPPQDDPYPRRYRDD